MGSGSNGAYLSPNRVKSVPSPLWGEGQDEGEKQQSRIDSGYPPSPQPSPQRGEGENKRGTS